MDLHWLPYPQRITYKLCVWSCLSSCVALPLLILLTIALVLWCPVDRLWDLLLMVTLLFLDIGLTGVWDLLRWLAPAVGMLCLLFDFFLFWFRYFCKALIFGLVYSRQGTHFWVCITFCRVRHGCTLRLRFAPTISLGSHQNIGRTCKCCVTYLLTYGDSVTKPGVV